MAAKTTKKSISPKQIDFMIGLTKVVGESVTLEYIMNNFSVVSILDLDSKQASDVINHLMEERDKIWNAERAINNAINDVKNAELTKGIYISYTPSRLPVPVRVYPSQSNSVRLLAKALINGEWVYQGAAHKLVTPDMKMTLEQAQKYGLDFGVCACCGRVLTERESIMRGIGPVCWKKYF